MLMNFFKLLGKQMIGGKVKTKYLENYQTIVKGIKMARTETRTQVPFQNNE